MPYTEAYQAYMKKRDELRREMNMADGRLMGCVDYILTCHDAGGQMNDSHWASLRQFRDEAQAANKAVRDHIYSMEL